MPIATPADELRHTTEEQARHSDINLTMNTHIQLDIRELAGDVETLRPVPGRKPPGDDSEVAICNDNGHQVGG